MRVAPERATPQLPDQTKRGILFVVTAKQEVLQAVRDLPDDASFEDAMQRLLFLAKIDRGLEQADAGQTIPDAEVKEKTAKWLK